MVKLLRGSRNPNTHIGPQGGRGQLCPKISNFLNKLKTMLVGALLEATGLLSSRIFFFLKLDKKWSSYELNRDAQIWARQPNFAVFGSKLGQISIFWDGTNFI